MMFCSPLTLHFLCLSLSSLHGRKASRFVHSRRWGVGLSVEVGLSLRSLYIWWGKPWLVTSRSRPSLVVVPKALGMDHLSVGASPFRIDPPPHSDFCPLAPYCPFSLHLTAKNSLPGCHPTGPHGLAPYYYLPAGTLLLVSRPGHPLCPVPRLTYLPPALSRPFHG